MTADGPHSLSVARSNRTAQVDELIDQNKLGIFLCTRPDEILLLTGYYPHCGATVYFQSKGETPVLLHPIQEPYDFQPLEVEHLRYDPSAPGQEDCSLAGLCRSITGLPARHRGPLGFLPQMQKGSTSVNSPESNLEFSKLFTELASPSNEVFVDVSEAFSKLYMHKLPEEIPWIRLANCVAMKGIEEFHLWCRPGITEAELAGRVEMAVQKTMDCKTVRFARAWAFVQSGAQTQYAGTFSRTTGRFILSGEVVVLELAVCVNGYWSDLTRTAIAGDESSSTFFRQILNDLTEAQKASAALIAPGMRSGLLQHRAKESLLASGLTVDLPSIIGHHVGFRYHDPGEPIHKDAPWLFEAGMVVTIEPGVYGPRIGAGFRVEDNFLVTAEGCEILSY